MDSAPVDGEVVSEGEALIQEVNAVAEAWDETEVLPEARHPANVAVDRDPLASPAALPVSDRQTDQSPAHLHTGAHENQSSVGIDAHMDRHPSNGQFVKGNTLWREGQTARIAKAVAVRTARLARTKAIMESLEQVDCEAAVRKLVELTQDDDAKIALAAIKLVLDTVVVKDGGEVDPEGRSAGGDTFIFQIPIKLPTSPR